MNNDYNIFLKHHIPTIGYTLGSFIAEIIALPIFTVKTNYQTSLKITDTPLDVIKNIYQKRGVKGFYNAIIPAITARITSSCIKFALYNEIKYYRNNENNDIFNNMLNGCITGVLSSFIVHPIEVISIRMQNFDSINKNLFNRNKLYSGFSQTLIRNFVLYSVLFPVFDYNKYITNNNIILSCLITCFISTIILQPIDYLRTIMMSGKYHYNFKTIIKNSSNNNFITNLNNMKILYKGYHLNYCSVSVHFTVAMLITHYFCSYFA
jgi:hypothetical protein